MSAIRRLHHKFKNLFLNEQKCQQKDDNEWHRMAVAPHGRWMTLNDNKYRRLAIQQSQTAIAIKGEARMSLNAINQKSFPLSAFRFPFFANFAK